jgi:RimJ/RimL family protein N-acetyltransferase
MYPDAERIKAILRHPEVYPHIRDDYSPPADAFTPPPGYYLEPVEGVLVSLRPKMETLWEAHIAALPEARGRGSEAVKLAADWLRTNTRAEQVLAMFPDDNAAVHRMVERSGFVRVGEVPSSFRRDGRLLSLHIYSLRIR